MEHTMLITLQELLSSDALTSLFITLWAQMMGAPIYAKAISRNTKKAIRIEFDSMLKAAKDGLDRFDVDINTALENVWESISFEERSLLGDEYFAQEQLFEAFQKVRGLIWCYEAKTQINTENIW